MKKFKIYLGYFLVAFGLNGCYQSNEIKHNDNDNNAMLANIVKVQSLQSMVDDKNPEWMKGIDVDNVYDLIVEPVLQLKNDVYYTDVPLGTKSTTKKTRAEIKSEILQNCTNGVCPKNEFNKLYFLEEWNFDKKNFTMSKKIVAYMPVRRWIRNQGEVVHQALFQIIQEENTKKAYKELTKIGSDVKYEYEFSPLEYTDVSIGIDRMKFTNYIFDGIINNDIKAYEPTYLVDNSKTLFSSRKDLELICIDSLGSNELRSHISSLIFVEDWYIDKETLFFYKIVKGIGFLKKGYNPPYDKKVLFFVFFDK